MKNLALLQNKPAKTGRRRVGRGFIPRRADCRRAMAGDKPPAYGLLFLLVLVGCGGGKDRPLPESQATVCASRADCPEKLGCVDGICAKCARDRDCLGTEWCHPLEHLCAPAQGGECQQNANCAFGSFCVRGTCRTVSEVTLCSQPGDCLLGERCDPVNLVCLPDAGCNRDADCALSEVCDPAAQRCLPACSSESAEALCGAGMRCDPTGHCVECYQDDQCGAGLGCDPVTLRCAGQNSCTTDRDCPVEQICNPQTHQCTPRAGPCLSSADCPPGATCHPELGQCRVSLCPPDALEPNDDLSRASPLSPGPTRDLRLCPGDVDWFSIALARGDRVQVQAETNLMAAGQFHLQLRSPDSADVLQTDSLLIDRTVSTAGAYLLRVWSADPEQAYSLFVSLSPGTPCDDDAHEPNDTPSTATALTTGRLSGLVRCPHDDDWYALTRSAGQILQISLELPVTFGDLDLDLLSADGQTLLQRSATASATEQIIIDAQPGTRFTLRVYGAPETRNQYELIVTRLSR